ncbi:MAG TPA: transglycosylase SLT domain-containing protein [Patescibacteria group bacterium]|nr:transglycosylase SLT domain-containing protein [Patescibacteria group bacterium]
MRKRINLILFLVGLGLIGVLAAFKLPGILADQLYPLRYVKEIRECSAPYNLDEALVAAFIKQESNFNPKAVSRAGASGLGQIMPATAAGIARKLGIPSYDIFDPKTNVCFTTFYIAGMLGRYNGDLVAAAAAYNGGAAVGDRVVASRNAAIPGETSRYIVAVPRLYEVYKEIYGIKLKSVPDDYSGSMAGGEGYKTFVQKQPPKKLWDVIINDLVGKYIK